MLCFVTDNRNNYAKFDVRGYLYHIKQTLQYNPPPLLKKIRLSPCFALFIYP